MTTTAVSHQRTTARPRLLSATALAVMWSLAPDLAWGQAMTPQSQAGAYGGAPMTQAEAMAQIQQMQRQMEQLQRQIQQMQGTGAPAVRAPMAQPVAMPRNAAMLPQRKPVPPAVTRSKNRQAQPLAASVYTSKALAARGADTTAEVAATVPNMVVTRSQGLGAANDTYIRGMGTTETLSTYDPAVGLYVDDIYVGRTNFSQFNFFDLEGIEVLRGPQGTASAHHNSGGAVHIAFQKPQDRLSGNFEIGYGNYSTKIVRGAINAPVSDVILTQLGVYYNDDKGVVRNTTTTERLNDKRNYGVRAATELRPSEAWTWNIALNHTYANELNVLGFQCEMFGTPFASPGAPTPAADCNGRFARTSLRKNTIPSLAGLQINTGGGPVATTLANLKQERKVGAPTRNTLISSNIAYDINATNRLNIITGYIDLSQAYNYDLQDGRPGRTLATPSPATPIQAGATNGYYTLVGKSATQTYSQEARLTGDILNGAVEYMTGLYFSQERSRNDAAEVVLSVVNVDRLIKNKNRTYAAYLQTDLHVTQNFTGTLGIRFTNASKRLNLRDLRTADPVVGGVARPDLRLTTANLLAAGLPDRIDSKIFTPRIALDYALSTEAHVYASATRGFRAGGWNVHGTDVSTFTTYDNEKIWTYELGAKIGWLNDALRTNVALFNSDVTDVQVNSTPTSAALIPSYNTATPSNYRVRGIEAEVQAMPFQGMMAYANVGYQTADYQDIPSALNTQATACRALLAAGQPAIGVCGTGLVSTTGAIADPVRTPKLTAATGLSLDMPTGMGFLFTPAMNITYQSRWQNDASNVSFFASADPNTNPAAVTTTPNATGGSGFISGSRSGNVFLLNVSLAVTSEDARWGAVLECDNCLNKAYSTSSIAGYSFLNDPRRWALRLKTSF